MVMFMYDTYNVRAKDALLTSSARRQAGLGLVLGSFLGIGSFLRVRRLSIILKQQEERERESREQREPPLAGRGRGRLLVAVRAVVSPPLSLSLRSVFLSVTVCE